MHAAAQGVPLRGGVVLRHLSLQAVAGTKARVRMYPKKEIFAALGLNPAWRSSTPHRCRGRCKGCECSSNCTASERARGVLQFLLLEAGPDSLELSIRGSLKDVAAGLGLAHETFYRELARLEKAGIIAREGTTIRSRKCLSYDPSHTPP